MSMIRNSFNSPERRKRREEYLSIFSEDYRGFGYDESKEMDYDRIHLELKLIPKEDVIVGKQQGHPKLHIVNSVEDAELKRFALMTINDRIAFCRKYKTGEEEVGKCACESIRRYIRLSKESASRAISKDKINAIKKMFEEMKKEGKIKCQDKENI